MRRFFWSLLFIAMCLPVLGQEQDTISGDTTIYTVAEEMPRFPVCEKLDTTLVAIKKCAQEQLLAFVYQNVVYPFEARQNGNEGTAVISFIVEKDGSIVRPEIMKDIGGGCGAEALRVVNLMPEAGLKWVPGKNKGEAVRVRFVLPVRFRLEEAPPYVISGADTIWTQLDTPLEFEGGIDALTAHMDQKLEYPEIGNDSCRIGSIDVQIIVNRANEVKILDMTDYNDLGFDFWYEAISAATSTYGKWKLATFEDKVVPAAYEISVTFVPTDPACKQTIDDYNEAANWANEGLDLIENEEEEAGLAKLSQAIARFPNDATFLFMRGQAYIDMNRLAEACEDLSKARRISLVNSYDSILPLICR